MMHTWPPTSASRRGFTLVEAIATIVILGVVMSACSRLISAATTSYASASTRAELHAELASAMERIMLELRSCQSDPGGSTTPDILAVRSDRITWTTPSGERTLSRSGSSLVLTASGSDCTLVAGITSLAIQTYDDQNEELDATLDEDECQEVQRVQITLTAQRLNITESLRSRVFLRCVAAGSAAP